VTEKRDSPNPPEPEDLDVDARDAEDVKGGQAHTIKSPRDSASGQATGKTGHTEITIAKLND